MEEFDVIVIGAGPAGSSTAYLLAREGFDVLIVERANMPGSKNVFGGRIYSYPFLELYPNFWKDAPIERMVEQENMVFMTEKESVTMRLSSTSSRSFTTLRENFDSWMAKKAEDAGALLITGTRVDDLHHENGRVAGIIAGPDTVKCKVVVAADGVVSTFARKAGLRNDLKATELSIAVKEVIRLPRKTIEERFNLGENDGAAYTFIGYPSEYMRGGGFIYTNRETVSLGVVVNAEDITRQRREIFEIIENFKMHPYVQRLVAGGELAEYSAHMIPETGLSMISSLFGDNILVVGDAGSFLINHGYTYRGVDLAVLSGISAAEAIIRAQEMGDFSRKGLSTYPKMLKKRGVLDEMVKFRRAPLFLQNDRIFDDYPRIVCGFLRKMYSVNGVGKEKMIDTTKKEIIGKISALKMFKDILNALRSL